MLSFAFSNCIYRSNGSFRSFEDEMLLYPEPDQLYKLNGMAPRFWQLGFQTLR